MANMAKHSDTNLPQADAALRWQAEQLAGEMDSPLSENIQTPSPDAIRHMLHDLHVHQIELEMQNDELRRTQAELEQERSRYFDLYDLAPVGYCTISESGLIQQTNLTAATLLGMSRQALIAQPISRFIDKADQDIYYLCHQQLIATGRPQTCELRLVENDGTQCWVNLATTYALDDSHAPVLRMALTEITESKIMAAAMQESESRYRTLSEVLLQKNVELESARAVAEKANLAKSDFLSSMSHELRTPLSAILGFAQLIDAGPQAPTPSQKQSLGQIIKAGWYLLDLINEILDLAQIESGKLPLALEPIALTAAIQECLAMVEPQAQKYGVSMTFLPDEKSHFVHADRLRVKQTLINLLSNAIKYNQRGGSVVVNYFERAPGRLRISVQDTGEGLSPEKLAQLFQPFNRLGREASSVNGTGIGLVVCKRLVELMDGAIGVESTVGTGSMFWIDLNLTTQRPPLAPTHVQADAPVRTLLYVEDNPANLMLVQELIERRSDLRLLSAIDGQQGIELARSAQPDLILMDICLPDISGIEALRILAQDPTTAHIPVVALSAYALPHDIASGLKAGFVRYLTKPIKVHELMETLDLTLNLETASTPAVKRESI